MPPLEEIAHDFHPPNLTLEIPYNLHPPNLSWFCWPNILILDSRLILDSKLFFPKENHKLIDFYLNNLDSISLSLVLYVKTSYFMMNYINNFFLHKMNKGHHISISQIEIISQGEILLFALITHWCMIQIPYVTKLFPQFKDLTQERRGEKKQTTQE